MKNKYFMPVVFGRNAIRIVASAVIAAAPAYLAAGTAPAPEPSAPVDEPAANWATFTIGGAFIDGNKAAYQRAAGQDGDFYGGVGSLHWTAENNGINYLVDGHAIFGNQDFDILMSATKDELGYVKLGYKEFRTWYDGSGGYVPGIATSWWPLYDDDRHVDRGEVWLEAGLRMENLPEITFRYTHAWRDGTKDSTFWSRTTDGYAHAPSFYDLDERRDVFELDVEHTLGNTDLGLSLCYENGSLDNVRTQRNNPGDAAAANDRTITNTELTDYDLFSASLFSTTRLNEQMLLSFGYNFLTMDTDTRGQRTSIRRDGIATTSDHAYSALVGGANLSHHTLNGAFNWTPLADLAVTTSLRAGWEEGDAISTFFEGGPARDSSDQDFDSLAEEIEIRYTGVENLVFYTRGEFEQGDDDVAYREVGGDMRFKSVDIDQQKYVLGANYYPVSGLSFSGQYYYSDYEADYGNSYRFTGTNAFDAQLAGYGSETDDVNFRVTWRAMPGLTFVTRYDYQQSTVNSQGISGTGAILPNVESADIERQILSQSVTWLPLPRAYVQGTVSFIWAETDTPANIQAPYRITDCSNDSITANLTAGYALSDQTDLLFGYTYLYASNFAVPRDAAGVPGSVPFGTDLEEHVFSVSLNHQISQNMLWNIGYGYYTSNDGTSGGNNDFDAHMLSTGLQVRF